jgi:hypothetical protein
VGGTRSEETPRWAPYRPALRRAAQAAAGVAIVTGALELAVGPHRLISLVFLVAGPAIGAFVGRALARGLADWAADARPVSRAERAAVVTDERPSPYAAGALALVGIAAAVVPLRYRIPTPLPGGLAAVAVQAALQARALAAVERRRKGTIVRPVGRLSFEGEELRLLPDPAGEEATGQG